MNSKLQKNAVLTGFIDSFCLVCEAHLLQEKNAWDHVAQVEHRKNLDSCPYLDKFAGDCIRKVKKGYFCEFCNLVLPTASKVSVHITEDNHNDKKGTHQIQRIGNQIVIFNNLLISELAWNGIMEDMCAVCNAEFLNLNLHTADQKHVLNLIQKKVEFGIGNVIFRKIDDLSFQCLICNMIYALNILEIHHDDEVHKTNILKCQDGYRLCKDIVEYNKENSNIKIHNVHEKGKDTVNGNQGVKTNNNSFSNAKQKKLSEEKEDETTKPVQKADLQKTKKTKKKQNSKTNEPTETKIFNNSIKDEETGSNNKDEGTNTALIEICNQNTELSQIIEEDQLIDFVKYGINIDFLTDTAYCRKCFEHVEFDLYSIQKHIETHKENPTKKGPNVAETVDRKNSKTLLYSRDIDENHEIDKTEVAKKYNVELNHNGNLRLKSDENEEMIKIDLKKEPGERFEEYNSNLALMSYIPCTANSEPVELEVTKGNKPKTNEKVDTNDPIAYAQAHKLTINKGSKNAFCRICNIRIPASIKNMKEHVSGSSHTRKAIVVAKAEKFIPKKPMAKFIHQRSTVMDVTGVDDIILNDKFCLTRMSYYMITMQNRLRCQACEVSLTEDEVIKHVDSAFHERAMNNTPVLWTLDDEFVREVRPDIFHCGYCNLIVGKYDDVSKHLTCSEHSRNKSSAISRLSVHLPPILEHREHREERIMRAMFEHFGHFCF